MDFRHFWLRGRSRGPRNHFDDHEGTEFQKIIAFRHEILYSSFSLEFMYVYFLFVNRGFMQYMYAPSLCKHVKCIVFFVVDLESSQLKYIWWPQTSNKLRAFGTCCCVGSFSAFKTIWGGLFWCLCRSIQSQKNVSLAFSIIYDALQVTGYTISSNDEKINNCLIFLSNLERSMVLGAILLVLSIFIRELRIV